MEKQIFTAGTIRSNRFRNPLLNDDRTLAKKGIGACSEVVSNDSKIAVEKWY